MRESNQTPLLFLLANALQEACLDGRAARRHSSTSKMGLKCSRFDRVVGQTEGWLFGIPGL